MIDGLAEVSHEDTGEKHTGCAQADALHFDTSQRHPHDTNKGEHADSVRNGLDLITRQATGAAPFTSALAPAA
jgi:hypothetical protein